MLLLANLKVAMMQSSSTHGEDDIPTLTNIQQRALGNKTLSPYKSINVLNEHITQSHFLLEKSKIDLDRIKLKENVHLVEHVTANQISQLCHDVETQRELVNQLHDKMKQVCVRIDVPRYFVVVAFLTRL